jgi:hypothetical protein
MAHPHFAAQSIAEIGQRPFDKRARDDDLRVEPDRGCRVWHRCLTCPLPVCISDLSPPQQRLFWAKVKELMKERKRRAAGS